MSTYLPKCCSVRPDGSGRYEVAHTETSELCRHDPSGGMGGFPDGQTRCNRIIGHGATKREAIEDARECLGESANPAGRPPKSGAGQTRKAITVKLPPAMVELLACIARDSGLSQADIVTAALTAYAPIAADLYHPL